MRIAYQRKLEKQRNEASNFQVAFRDQVTSQLFATSKAIDYLTTIQLAAMERLERLELAQGEIVERIDGRDGVTLPGGGAPHGGADDDNVIHSLSSSPAFARWQKPRRPSVGSVALSAEEQRRRQEAEEEEHAYLIRKQEDAMRQQVLLRAGADYSSAPYPSADALPDTSFADSCTNPSASPSFSCSFTTATGLASPAGTASPQLTHSRSGSPQGFRVNRFGDAAGANGVGCGGGAGGAPQPSFGRGCDVQQSSRADMLEECSGSANTSKARAPSVRFRRTSAGAILQGGAATAAAPRSRSAVPVENTALHC